jgi:hypothetical protein
MPAIRWLYYLLIIAWRWGKLRTFWPQNGESFTHYTSNFILRCLERKFKLHIRIVICICFSNDDKY